MPPWWEFWWVRSGFVALLAAAGFGAYRIRLAQINQQFAIRLEERVVERTRIARDIHDSLLQGFQGLILRLQAVRNVLPIGRPTPRPCWTRRSIAPTPRAEGRDKVVDLRAAAGSALSLPDALASLRDEIEVDWRFCAGLRPRHRRAGARRRPPCPGGDLPDRARSRAQRRPPRCGDADRDRVVLRAQRPRASRPGRRSWHG